jgi:hypothetical protein
MGRSGSPVRRVAVSVSTVLGPVWSMGAAIASGLGTRFRRLSMGSWSRPTASLASASRHTGRGSTTDWRGYGAGRTGSRRASRIRWWSRRPRHGTDGRHGTGRTWSWSWLASWSSGHASGIWLSAGGTVVGISWRIALRTVWWGWPVWRWPSEWIESDPGGLLSSGADLSAALGRLFQLALPTGSLGLLGWFRWEMTREPFRKPSAEVSSHRFPRFLHGYVVWVSPSKAL